MLSVTRAERLVFRLGPPLPHRTVQRNPVSFSFFREEAGGVLTMNRPSMAFSSAFQQCRFSPPVEFDQLAVPMFYSLYVTLRCGSLELCSVLRRQHTQGRCRSASLAQVV